MKITTFNFKKKALATACAAGVVMLMASSGAQALTSGTEFGLLMKPAAGGMGGAAYTKPQEASAALFGNPATMTQLKGTHVGFGASYLDYDLNTRQYLLDGTFLNQSDNAANKYILPDFALTREVAPGLVFGVGVEVDAGLGADYRDDPVTIAGGSATIPLVVEIISFNANVGLAKQITPQLSVGAAATIAFGLAQLGTAGPTTGLDSATGGAVPDFGGTTGSVHDIGFGGSLGMTYQATQNVMLSAAVKSPVKYNFKNIVNFVGSWQSLPVEQPLKVALGAAVNVTPNLLIEADAIWRNWSKSDTYQDVFDDQWTIALGGQYTMGPLKLRLGYQYAEDLMRGNPHGTLGGLPGLGNLPLNTAVPSLGLGQNDIVRVVQATLVPIAWQHTWTAGLGYDLSPNIRLDVHGAVAMKDDITRSGISNTIGTHKAELKGYAVGAGLNFKF